MQDSGVELLVDCMGFLVRVLFPGSRESKPRLKAGKQSCSGADCFPIGYRSGLNQWFCGCMWPLYRSQWFC